MVGSPEEMIGILKGEVKTLREKDTKLERENKTLREENKRLKAGKTETWEELQDEEGRVYYYNRTSGETSWEPPMISNPMRK